VSFSFDSFAGTGRTFPLRDGHPPVVLDAEGIRHPRSSRSPERQHFTAFEDITHVAVSARVMWLGTRESVYMLSRGGFARFDALEQLAAAISDGIAARPGGAEQLERMGTVSQRLEDAPVPRATRALIGICIAVYALQWLLSPAVELSGQYSSAMVADGDLWRVVTANLLHAQGGLGGIWHITTNMLLLGVFGTMVERPLGTVKTLCVMVASGLGAMLFSGWMGPSQVMGASGIVCGLVGSALWLDYRRAEELPSPWRFPRRILLIVIFAEMMIGAVVPVIALAAHAGGLLAGALATAAVTGVMSAPPPLWTRLTCGVALFATFSAVATGAMDVLTPGDPIARYTTRLARLPDISAVELNDAAWILATATNPAPSREVLVAALALAERAVSATDREEPTILDTLAEVHFQLGEVAAAVAVIEEAIRRAPEEPYYREQLRRFIGERAPDDRPDYMPPFLGLPTSPNQPGDEPPTDLPEGISI
jgi:membrane associated rhomboid family serine protease